jgi:hypothetical protein
MSGILNASCCCGGGTIPPGNTTCVPIVGTTTPTFTITASQAGWVRGNPVGLSTSSVCATYNCGTPTVPQFIYCSMKTWSGWNNSIGAFQGKYYRDAWFRNDTPNCECCPITEDTLTFTGGSWSATCQFTTAANGVQVLSESNTFESGGITAIYKYLCSGLNIGGICTTCGCCAGATGLYDVIRVVFSGFNTAGPYYSVQAENENNALICDPPYDSTYQYGYYHQWTLEAWYYKPVPFTATRTLTGVYTRYTSRVTVPQNFYQTHASFGGPWNSLSYTSSSPPGSCTINTGGYPTNDPECLCGTANGFGFTIPATLTLA